MLLSDHDLMIKRTAILLQQVREVKHLRSRMKIDELADVCLSTPARIEIILNMIDEHSDWDDEEIAENLNFQKADMLEDM